MLCVSVTLATIQEENRELDDTELGGGRQTRWENSGVDDMGGVYFF